jgi:hypothetical protein
MFVLSAHSCSLLEAYSAHQRFFSDKLLAQEIRGSLFSVVAYKEPREPAWTVGLLEQVGNRIDLGPHLCSVRGSRKTREDRLWGRFRLHLQALLDIPQQDLQLPDSSVRHFIVLEQPLSASAQVIDILLVIALNAPTQFPVALFMQDASDLLKLIAHSSAPAYLHQQEDVARDESKILLVYLSRHQGQLLLDRSLVDLQAAVTAHQGLDLRPDGAQCI